MIKFMFHISSSPDIILGGKKRGEKKKK